MKTIKNILLLVTLLCLVGCKDNSQNVSFSLNEVDVSSDMSSFSVNVEADCSWRIERTEGYANVDISFHTGPATVHVRVAKNDSYENVRHILTISSENGNSTDRLVINQEKMYAIIANPMDTLSCEGGNYELKLSSNDEISDIEVSDWISISSARSLKERTYTFTAEPNKTGSVRKGHIVLKGKKRTERVEILQDSYAPTNVWFTQALENTYLPKFSAEVSFEPEYADLNKIEISSQEGCHAYIEDGAINVSMNDYGLYALTFLHEGKIVSEGVAACLPEVILNAANAPYYVGQTVPVASCFKNEKFSFKVSDTTLASISDGTLEFKNTGTFSLEASVPGTEIIRKQTITADKVACKAWMDSYLDWGGVWQVEVIAEIRGKNLTEYTVAMTDNNKSLVVPFGKKEGSAYGKDVFIYRNTFGIHAYNLEDLRNKIQKCEVHYSVKSDGETVTGSVNTGLSR